jgi:hypothetical protein
MDTPPTVTPSAALGAGLRAVRLAHRARQEDVAAGARAVGLDWSRATVATIESGRRGLSVEELLLLPTILSIGIGASASLADLLVGDEPIALTPRIAVPQPALAQALSSVRAALAGPVDQAVTAARAKDLGDGVGDLFADEAEQTAAERLETHVWMVKELADQLWGRGLSAERDHRVAEQGEAPARTVQARRGHATRALLAELREAYASGRISTPDPRLMAWTERGKRRTANEGEG